MKKKTTAKIALAGFILVAALVAFTGNETPREKRRREIESQFSIVTGEHLGLSKSIKNNLSNPGSFKAIETNYSDMDTTIIVNTTYSYTDELNQPAKGFVKASINNAGTITVLEKR